MGAEGREVSTIEVGQCCTPAEIAGLAWWCCHACSVRFCRRFARWRSCAPCQRRQNSAGSAGQWESSAVCGIREAAINTHRCSETETKQFYWWNNGYGRKCSSGPCLLAEASV